MISLRHWVRKRVYYPLLTVLFFTVVIQASLITTSILSELKNQDTVLFRAGKTLSSAIAQSNRVVIESLLVNTQSELDADAIAICRQGNILISFPPTIGSCNTKPPGIVHRTMTLDLSGINDTQLVVMSPSLSNARYLAVSALVSLLSIAAIFYNLRRMASAVVTDIQTPMFSIVESVTTGEQQKEFCIDEISVVSKKLMDYVATIGTLSTERQELIRSAAIARTTQMLAHDVRKPFSTLKMGLGLIKQAKSTKEMQNMANLTLDAVEKAIVTVNGLIDDVMEIGRAGAPQTSPVAVESLIETALLELFLVHEKTTIDLDLRLDHPEDLAFSIEQLKVLRVFSNILGNGIQAMIKRGKLLIATRETTVDGQPFIEVTLGNSGPAIPDEALPQLFEAFYTSGKAGGTGLGLAIAKKVVTAHGGRIWCESPGSTMPVEFHFTLPATKDTPSRARLSEPLPATSAEVYERLKPNSSTLVESSGTNLIEDPRETKFERTVLAVTGMRNRPLRVVVIDDDLIYRDTVTRLLGDNQSLQRAVILTTVSSGSEALEDPTVRIADVVICDIDLGVDSCNGYEVVKTLRARKFPGIICVHSNRSLPEDFKRAVEVGADTVFPKPMGRAHLLQILATAGERFMETRYQSGNAGVFPYRFAVIEDDRIVRSAWQAKFGDRVQLFASATDFLGDGSIMEQVRDALLPFDFIVTDFHLDEKSEIPTGGMVATIVNRFHPIPVFLCSSVEWNEATFSKLFAGHLSKFDDFVAALTELVEKTGLKPRTTVASLVGGACAPSIHPHQMGESHAAQPPTTQPSPTPSAQDLSIDALLALRHDIRNQLANVQIIVKRMPDLDAPHAKESADHADLFLTAIEPHCDRSLIAQIRSSFARLVEIPSEDPSRPAVLRQIFDLAQELTLAHHMDPVWIDLETHPRHKKS